MQSEEIRQLVASLDTRNSTQEENAWAQLRPLAEAVTPYLEEFYPQCRSWQGRVALVFHSIRFARKSPSAVALGIRALNDRSFMVRYRACGLLAYSLRRDALEPLRQLLNHSDQRTVEDAAAAIDAITHQNHHLFVARDHSGRQLREARRFLRGSRYCFWRPLSISISDPVHSVGELRFVLIGMTFSGNLVVVVHVERGENIRLISARLATRKERHDYEAG
mgnify:CR=1 FL=1